MKHGKKSEQTSDKSRGAGKKTGKASNDRGKKAAVKPSASTKSTKGGESRTTAKATPKQANSSRKPAGGSEAGAFTNAGVGAAFHRAVQKYGTAFKRLTD